MTPIKLRPYRRGGWEVDIHTRLPDGTPIRERVVAPVTGKTAAMEWARQRERILALGLDRPPAPTCAEFAKVFLARLEAARHKPAGIAVRRRALDLHLLPIVGAVRLDKVTEEHVDAVKDAMQGQAPRSVNSVLGTLRTMLILARRRKMIAALPCEIEMVRVPRAERPFYDFEDFGRLVRAAATVDPKAHLLVLLGGRAGLRRGEMIGLQWTDVNLERGVLTVRRQINNGRSSGPKGGHEGTVPLASELAAALTLHRHLRGDYVLAWDDGGHLNETSMRRLMSRACRAAGLPDLGLHALRHSFISHLVMRGVPMRTVQEYARHERLTTTAGYMHLSPRAIAEGIRALDDVSGRPVSTATGDLTEAPRPAVRKTKERKR